MEDYKDFVVEYPQDPTRGYPKVIEIETRYDPPTVKVGNWVTYRYISVKFKNSKGKYVPSSILNCDDVVEEILKSNLLWDKFVVFSQSHLKGISLGEINSVGRVYHDFEYGSTGVILVHGFFNESYKVNTKDFKKLNVRKLFNQFMAEHFGPNFLRRLEGAIFNTFVAKQFPKEAWGAFWDGRHFQQTKLNETLATKNYKQYIKDGYPNLIPLLYYDDISTKEAKDIFGDNLWKHMCKSSCYRNKYLVSFLRALTVTYPSVKNMFRTISDKLKELPASRLKVLEINTYILHYITAQITLEEVLPMVLRLSTEVKNSSEVSNVLNTLDDTIRMGVAINPKWSFKRLKEEHDKASKALLLKKYSNEPFEKPLQFTLKGSNNQDYTFTRLITPLEIAAEGSEMKHCVGSYASSALKRTYDVWKVEGKHERATLGIFKNSGHYPWKFQQCYGSCNQRVTEGLNSAALKLVTTINDHEGRKTQQEAA